MSKNAIFLGKAERPQFLNLKYANRHGLIAGATGTGRAVTLQILAEGVSKAGIPVFAAAKSALSTASNRVADERLRGLSGALRRR